MKAAVYHGSRDVRVESVPEPPALGPEEILLRVDRAGICGTDAGEYLYGPKQLPIERRHHASGHEGPLIIGHEIFGTIDAVGSNVEHLHVGDRIVPGAGMWCGSCDWCKAGKTNLCESYYTLGLQANGGLAELVNLPARMCQIVPPDCTDLSAAVAQPLAVALHAVRRGRVEEGSSVVIIGVGGIGFLLLAGALSHGANPIIAVDVDPDRLARADAYGASVSINPRELDTAAALLEMTDGLGFDVVFEASGAEPSAALAQRVVRRGGTVLLVGLHNQPRSFDVTDLVLREVELISTLAHVCDVDLPEALQVLRDDRLAAGALDREIELDAIVDEGLEPLAEGNVNGKILVDVD
jgi:(R,R)-butanediol dehydrogenase/meso-butanediol dehydrogenase/diacetyl reductase